MSDLLLKAAIALLSMKPKPILHYMKRHFGRDPRKFPIVQAEFPRYRTACVYLALQRFLSEKRRRGVMLGIASGADSSIRMVDIIHPDYSQDIPVGPVQYHNVTLSNGANLSCVRSALYLVRDGYSRFAVVLSTAKYDDALIVEVISSDRKIAEDFLTELRALADANSIYKGQVISLKMDSDRNLEATFQDVPAISAEQLILPSNVLEQVERHAIRFSAHREVLLSRGRHLKRGLLLFGPPGTGKSLTVMYLLTEMRDRTKILLNGSSITRLEDACALARALQPATIVIDDVDLLAEERSRRQGNPILFELLNQMDGIADDADVLFILTTNRPEILEPAIASRPGRIDQAVMIPLPDRDCRARLFELYAKGLTLEVSDLRKFVEQTEDASAAFIRELFRSASLLALEEGVDVPIHDRHLGEALEMLKSSLTGKFLGWQSLSDVDPGSVVADIK